MNRSASVPFVLCLALFTVLGGCQQQEAAEESTAVTTLQSEDVTIGTGLEAVAGDLVVVHYTGWLWVDGAKGDKFDSSVDRGKPFTFPLGGGQVIKGWDQGVAGMKVGGKRNLIIPPDLAYGSQSNSRIPANSTLYFEVELLEVPRVEIEEVAVGDGPLAEDGDTVSVHYTGWLFADGQRGTQFDSSSNREEPLTFDLGRGQVIRGWDHGIDGMKVGGKRVVTIPPALAYGERGRLGPDGQAVIPPNATLQFEVELTDVMGKQ